ncbi:MAG: hypothetical protein JO250_02630 [Armatimonadetes bacterium]|nr:hypothetical protein [Armatimonadota bacterium]
MKSQVALFRNVGLALAVLAGLILTSLHARAQGSWSEAAPLPGAGRYGLAAATALDGRIFAFGGGEELPYGIYNDTYAYDPTTNTWSAEAPMPTGRVNFGAVTGPDGRIYMIGGEAPDGSFPNAVDVYDPSANTWTSGPPLPAGRNGGTAVLGQDGKIYVFAGATNGALTNTTYAYNLRSRSWSPVAPIPTARLNVAAALGPDGNIYVFGGVSGPNNTPTLNTAEAYNPATNTWSTKAPMPTARSAMAAETGADGRIYVYGGYNPNPELSNLAVTEIYDPRTDTWASGPSLVFWQSYFAGAAGRDGRLYAIAGFDPSSSFSRRVQVFTPSSGSGGVGGQTSLQISNVNASTTSTSATITWNTNVPADSAVTYSQGNLGLVARASTVPDPTLRTQHSITLQSLSGGTLYSYIVQSTDASGNKAFGPLNTFVTKPEAPGPGSGGYSAGPPQQNVIKVTFQDQMSGPYFGPYFWTVTSATLNGVSMITTNGLPNAIGDSVSITIPFPASAGTPGTQALLAVNGTVYESTSIAFYKYVPFGGSGRVTIPAVSQSSKTNSKK